MVKKWEAKKEALYKPSSKTPQIVDVPAMKFATISGAGNPNTSEDFAQAIQALYGLSYTIKMMPKKGIVPKGYFEYTVPPLEGLWDVTNMKGFDASQKDNLSWTIMIRQPSFVDDNLFEQAKTMAKGKKGDTDGSAFSKLRFETITDGLCCQFLHIGPFDDEAASFERMEEFITKEGYKKAAHFHREIYLSDFRKSAPEKMRTILRFRIQK